MSGVASVAATVCACCVIVALLSHFVTDGGTKRLLSLVMGAFILCSMLVPVGKAVGSISVDWQALAAEERSATDDEAFNREVLSQTRTNLENTLKDVLTQNGYSVKNAAVTLAIAGENRVVIASVTLTVGAAYADVQEGKGTRQAVAGQRQCTQVAVGACRRRCGADAAVKRVSL